MYDVARLDEAADGFENEIDAGCANKRRLPQPGQECDTEIAVDLCQDVTVLGACTGAGECVVTSAPPELTCPGCPGICIKCFIEICIPF